MSVKFRNQSGQEVIVAGLTPGGDIEAGAVAQRSGTFTISDIAVGGDKAYTVTFSDPMPDTDYEVTFEQLTSMCLCSVTDNTKTINGFEIKCRNLVDTVRSCKGTWYAIKTYTVQHAKQNAESIATLEAMVPAGAGSGNQLTTKSYVDNADSSLGNRVSNIEDLIPTTASITNQFATQSDLSTVQIDKLGDIADVDVTAVDNGQTILWDEANSKWVNGPAGKTYHAGDGIEISNTNTITPDEDYVPLTFVGTKAQWDALSAADKLKYILVNLTDDPATGGVVVSDSVADGNMNPVTSNAVANENYMNIQRWAPLTTSYGTGYHLNRIAKVGDHLYSINGSFSSNSHMSGILATFDNSKYHIQTAVIPCAIYDAADGGKGWTTGVLYFTTGSAANTTDLTLIGTNGATNIQRVCFSALIWAD